MRAIDDEQRPALPTPALADAVVRLGLPVRQAPAGICATTDVAVLGRARPVRHAGSVDVFLEVLGGAAPGDVLVIDNGGRRDEGCVGDLIAHEAHTAGIAAIVIWGLHRDVAEVDAIGIPVFSYGTVAFGPRDVRETSGDPFAEAAFGDLTVTGDDVVAADRNGVIFLPGAALDRIVEVATEIRIAELEQVRLLRSGTSLREQFDFDTYLQRRAQDPQRTFRQHLRERAQSIEE